MDLPITDKDLDFIMKLVEKQNKQLYDKLWIYKFDKLQKEKQQVWTS
jgi:hypothetical protein